MQRAFVGHECTTPNEGSLHLTLSIEVPIFADVVREAIDAFLQEPAYAQAAWRGRKLAPNAGAIFERARIDLDTHLRRVLTAGSTAGNRTAGTKGCSNIEHRMEPRAIRKSSTLVPVNASIWCEERDDDALFVSAGALNVTLPIAMSSSISKLRSGESVRVGQLMQDQPKPVLFALARELLRAGLVRLEQTVSTVPA